MSGAGFLSGTMSPAPITSNQPGASGPSVALSSAGDIFRGGRGGDGEAQAALAGVLDERRNAGPERQAAGVDEAQVVARLGGVQIADQCVEFGPGGDLGRVAFGVVAQAFLAAGDGEQFAVQPFIPVPIEAVLGKSGIEGGRWPSRSVSASVPSTCNFNSTVSVRDDIQGAVVASSAYNLVGDGTGMSGISHGVNNNLVGSGASPIDAKLLTLSDNGGSTHTHALDNGSPAIEQIPSGANGCGTTYTTDQRGYARPGTRNQPTNSCEMGAWEARASDPTVITLKNIGARAEKSPIYLPLVSVTIVLVGSWIVLKRKKWL